MMPGRNSQYNISRGRRVGRFVSSKANRRSRRNSLLGLLVTYGRARPKRPAEELKIHGGVPRMRTYVD
jgi:hypothetical protein